MAEGKGANIARLVSKQAGRAKEKVQSQYILLRQCEKVSHSYVTHMVLEWQFNYHVHV